jgi:hypothetical protein
MVANKESYQLAALPASSDEIEKEIIYIEFIEGVLKYTIKNNKGQIHRGVITQTELLSLSALNTDYFDPSFLTELLPDILEILSNRNHLIGSDSISLHLADLDFSPLLQFANSESKLEPRSLTGGTLYTYIATHMSKLFSLARPNIPVSSHDMRKAENLYFLVCKELAELKSSEKPKLKDILQHVKNIIESSNFSNTPLEDHKRKLIDIQGLALSAAELNIDLHEASNLSEVGDLINNKKRVSFRT